MSNNAMSNETDLDWLARNVHKWPEGKREVLVCYPRNVDALIWSCVLSNAGWITKEQWLARRAELASQFKPFTSIEDNQDREGANQKLNELEMLGKVSHLISDKRHRITTSKYTKTIHGVPVDVYDVLQAWGVSNPALQHLIKKALQCGRRGHKDNEQDLQDIIDSAIRAKELG